jgi:hypothetical protein
VNRRIRNTHKNFISKPEGKWPLRRLGIDGRIILIWILKPGHDYME